MVPTSNVMAHLDRAEVYIAIVLGNLTKKPPFFNSMYEKSLHKYHGVAGNGNYDIQRISAYRLNFACMVPLPLLFLIRWRGLQDFFLELMQGTGNGIFVWKKIRNLPNSFLSTPASKTRRMVVSCCKTTGSSFLKIILYVMVARSGQGDHFSGSRTTKQWIRTLDPIYFLDMLLYTKQEKLK